MGHGEVGLEPDRRAVFGVGLGQLPLVAQGDAEVVVGLGVVGLEPDRLAVFGDGLGQLPLGARAMPRLMWAAAKSGWSRIASRYSATASASFPWAVRARPRLWWAPASSGLSRIAARAAAIGPVEDRRRVGGPAVLLQVARQAGQVPRVVRPSVDQVAEDRLGLGAAAHPLEQVGQVVRRLGPQGAGRRVVPHRLLAGRRPQLVQGPGQGVVDPDVAGMAAGRGRSRATAASAWPMSARVRPSRTAVGAGSSAASGAAARAFSAAACGLRSSARRSCGGGRDTASGSASRATSSGFRQAATGRLRLAAHGRPVVEEGRQLDDHRLGLPPQPTGGLGGLQGVEVQPRVAEGGGVGGVGAFEADVLLIGPDLDQRLPQPASRSASSRPAWISSRRAVDRPGPWPSARSSAARASRQRGRIAGLAAGLVEQRRGPASTWANRAARRCRCWSR